MTTLSQLGAFLGARHKDLVALIVAKATPADISTAMTALKNGVPAAGDSLKKLYDLIVGIGGQWSVAGISARDALAVKLGDRVFVADDGDGRWAYYYATTSGPAASFVKLSDPDLLNAALTAAQIKAGYESNPDTNAFTDAQKAKLAALPDNATLTNLLNAKVNVADLGDPAGFEAAFAAALA